jgi:tetratricopeptide (TPR) repeat protein
MMPRPAPAAGPALRQAGLALLWLAMATSGVIRASGAGGAGGAGGAASFDEGRHALAAGDVPGALTRIEEALVAEPDNLRFASEYRQAVIHAGEYDRALAFFDKLVTSHPDASYAWLNYGYAYVDKMPAAGAITQVILADRALERFGRSLEIKPTWLGLYTRGNSYLYWPRVFGRAPLAVADLERAVAMAANGPRHAYHAHAWAALGDAYWQTDQQARARATWQEGARLFPEDRGLRERVARQGDELEAFLADALDRTKRVDTDLHELWEDR